MINVSKAGLLTIAGGKWTTYRAMAEETIDRAIQEFELKPNGPSQTDHIKLIGGHAWTKTMYIKLIQQFGLETDVAKHLAESYGDRAWMVASMEKPTGELIRREEMVHKLTTRLVMAIARNQAHSSLPLH